MKNIEREIPESGWQKKLHEVVFEADTRAGKAFDVLVIGLILLSLLAVILESVQSVREEYGGVLWTAEWAFTILFSIEYILRIISVRRPLRYMLSFFGLVD